MSKRGGGFPGGMPGGMNNLMKQAQRMQRQMEDAQKALAEKVFTARSGGGAVEASVSGAKKLTALKIAKEAVDPEDVETLEDLVIAAVNEAMAQADAEAESLMGSSVGGLF